MGGEICGKRIGVKTVLVGSLLSLLTRRFRNSALCRFTECEQLLTAYLMQIARINGFGSRYTNCSTRVLLGSENQLEGFGPDVDEGTAKGFEEGKIWLFYRWTWNKGKGGEIWDFLWEGKFNVTREMATKQ